MSLGPKQHCSKRSPLCRGRRQLCAARFLHTRQPILLQSIVFDSQPYAFMQTSHPKKKVSWQMAKLSPLDNRYFLPNNFIHISWQNKIIYMHLNLFLCSTNKSHNDLNLVSRKDNLSTYTHLPKT
jgi:hypothetical protein